MVAVLFYWLAAIRLVIICDVSRRDPNEPVPILLVILQLGCGPSSAVFKLAADAFRRGTIGKAVSRALCLDARHSMGNVIVASAGMAAICDTLAREAHFAIVQRHPVKGRWVDVFGFHLDCELIAIFAARCERIGRVVPLENCTRTSGLPVARFMQEWVVS